MNPEHDKLPPMIVLAGGKSERFGSPKGLARCGDQTMLAGHLRTYFEAGSYAVVVLGHIVEPYINEIETTRSTLSKEKSASMHYVVNPRPILGPFSSLQTGLDFLSEKSSGGIFVQPVDTGVVPPKIYRELYAASEGGKRSVIPEYLGKGGHPVFLSERVCKAALESDATLPESRLDVLLQSQMKGSVQRIGVSVPEILKNRNYC